MNTAEVLFTPFKEGVKEGTKQFVREVMPERKKPRQVIYEPVHKAEAAELERIRLELTTLMLNNRHTPLEDETSFPIANPSLKSNQLPSPPHSF